MLNRNEMKRIANKSAENKAQKQYKKYKKVINKAILRNAKRGTNHLYVNDIADLYENTIKLLTEYYESLGYGVIQKPFSIHWH